MINFLIAIAFLVCAATIWFVLLRPVPRQTARGIIQSKSYKPPGEYIQSRVGDRQGFWTPTIIPIAEGYVINIAVDDSGGKSALAHLQPVEADAYEIGMRVEFDYERRSIPLLWERMYVFNVRRIDDAPRLS